MKAKITNTWSSDLKHILKLSSTPKCPYCITKISFWTQLLVFDLIMIITFRYLSLKQIRWININLIIHLSNAQTTATFAPDLWVVPNKCGLTHVASYSSCCLVHHLSQPRCPIKVSDTMAMAGHNWIPVRGASGPCLHRLGPVTDFRPTSRQTTDCRYTSNDTTMGVTRLSSPSICTHYRWHISR